VQEAPPQPTQQQQQQQQQQVPQYQTPGQQQYQQQGAGPNAQEVASIVRGEIVVQEFRSKYPELAPFENSIADFVGQIQQEALQKGQQMDFRQSLDAGVQRFREQAGQVFGQPAPQQQQYSQQGVYPTALDARGMGQGQQRVTAEQGADKIWSMSSPDFMEMHEQFKQKQGY